MFGKFRAALTLLKWISKSWSCFSGLWRAF